MKTIWPCACVRACVFILIPLHDCLLFVASASARNYSPMLKFNKLDQDTQLNCSVVCIFLVHVALQDFQFVLASAQARNYAPMHQIRPRHAAEFQRGV